jgi:hypothetical protein
MNLAQRAADEVAGQRAAEAALLRVGEGHSDPELLLRALSRAMADAGRLESVPHATLSGFMRGIQKHIEAQR